MPDKSDEIEEDDGGVPQWLKDIRREDYEATKGMTPSEVTEYHRRRIEEARENEAQAK
jgi:hypothetical protein